MRYMTVAMLAGTFAAALTGAAVGHSVIAAQPTPTPSAKPSHHIVGPEAIVWRLSSPGFATAVVDGDLTKAGMFTMMLRLEDGAWIQPHWHNVDKRLVVIGGELLMGEGDAVNPSKTTALAAGGLAVVPAGMHHFEGARGLTVVALTAIGPFQTTYAKGQ